MSDSKSEKSTKPLEHLQAISGQPVSEQIASESGFLRPLGKILNTLLENPILRQAIGNAPPPGTKK